jgi:GTP diphosphokinase / guanosine-3',5'-bis(diphosphate) 3'-diphosphatase
MKTLHNEAVTMAFRAHKDQKDKGGKPYIIHITRVHNALQTEEEQIVGLLHDVVEDSDISIAEIVQVFGEKIADAVLALTHFDDEPYKDYIERVAKNPIAIKVKLVDLMDHLAPERVSAISDQLVTKYWAAFWRLTGALAEAKVKA